VKTARGTVLEFQHSFLSREERQSREAFYPDLLWVVDGTRRVRDRAQFFASLEGGITISPKPNIVALSSSDCALLRDWNSGRAPVYFDFGDSDPADTRRFDMPHLWRLEPNSANGWMFLSPVPKAWFVSVHRAAQVPLDQLFTQAVVRSVAHYNQMQQSLQSGPLRGFERYTARMRRARRRF